MKKKVGKLTANDVAAWTKFRLPFTTLAVAKHFHIRPTQAATFIAILRMRGHILPYPTGPKGESLWMPC